MTPPFPFRIPGHAKDYILEVNALHPAYIYCRNAQGETFRIIPLPGSEGGESGVWVARAADVVVKDNAVYVVFAMLHTENIAYTVDMNLLLDESAATSAPTFSLTTGPPTSAPTAITLSPSQAGSQPQQKDAPLEPKCGSVALTSGYGGVGGAAKGCFRRNLEEPNRKRIRGRKSSNYG